MEIQSTVGEYNWRNLHKSDGNINKPCQVILTVLFFLYTFLFDELSVCVCLMWFNLQEADNNRKIIRNTLFVVDENLVLCKKNNDFYNGFKIIIIIELSPHNAINANRRDGKYNQSNKHVIT